VQALAPAQHRIPQRLPPWFALWPKPGKPRRLCPAYRAQTRCPTSASPSAGSAAAAPVPVAGRAGPGPPGPS
jgi:hypothetical protein